jgi:hypothetical protein
MERPADTERCGVCNHPFAQHYTTYDSRGTGCSHYNDDQRDGGFCYCKGFAQVRVWRPLPGGG